VHRENFVQFDFIWFLAFLAPCFRNEDFACDHGPAVFQAALLRMVPLGGSAAHSRYWSAIYRVQTQVEESDGMKPGQAVLGLDLESLEKIEIRAV
jgi:hypothetical protein